MDILKADRTSLEELYAQLTAEYEKLRGLGLKLDMSRGKPARDQLDLCEPMLTVLSHNDQMQDGKTDVRNYGVLEGIPSCRALFATKRPLRWVTMLSCRALELPEVILDKTSRTLAEAVRIWRRI